MKCKGKRFKYVWLAMKYIQYWKKKRAEKYKPVEPYRCANCKQYHLKII